MTYLTSFQLSILRALGVVNQPRTVEELASFLAVSSLTPGNLATLRQHRLVARTTDGRYVLTELGRLRAR